MLAVKGARNPGSHGSHTDAVDAPSTVDAVPAGQASHFSGEVTPTSVENLPAGHGLHVTSEVCCCAELYVPVQAGHDDGGVRKGDQIVLVSREFITEDL